MARAHILLYVSTLTLTLFQLLTSTLSATFSITNNCDYTVWPGILSGAGTAPLQTTGFALSKGESRSVPVPASWSGRLWGRTLCSTDSSGSFSCETGDCGTSKIDCSGSGAIPPATLGEFTLNGSGGLDFYDVSLVDGYNLPMLVTPQGSSGGNCTVTGCLMDLNLNCPSDLKVIKSGQNVACRSACETFGSPEYCCSGLYGNPNTCKPSSYSQFFKNACPRSYSYAYDDSTSTFTCAGADYVITFCPSTTSQKARQESNNPPPPGLPVVDEPMVFLGGNEINQDSFAIPAASASAIFVLVSSWLLTLLLLSA